MSMTEVRVRRRGPEAARGEMLLVPVAEGQVSAALRRLDRRVRGVLARRARAARFAGKAEETLVHHGEAAVALLGLGPVPVRLDAWRRAGARGRQEAERERARRAGAYLGDAAADVEARVVLAGLLAVARGSREEPRFIRLRWAGAGARRRVILVGKGITFDSGGLSLKSPKAMETMKYDMAGGAAVIGAVAAAARLGLSGAVSGL